MEEERGHRTGPGPIAWSEVSVDERGRRATRVSHSDSITIGTVRRLREAGWNWDDEVAMEAALYPGSHSAAVICRGVVARTGTGAGRGYKAPVFELFDYQKRTIVLVLEYCKVSVVGVVGPVVSTSARVGRATSVGSVVRCRGC